MKLQRCSIHSYRKEGKMNNAEMIEKMMRLSQEATGYCTQGYASAKQKLADGQSEIEEITTSEGMECIALYDVEDYIERCLNRYRKALQGLVDSLTDFPYDMRYLVMCVWSKEDEESYKQYKLSIRNLVTGLRKDMGKRIDVIEPADFCELEKEVLQSINVLMACLSQSSKGLKHILGEAEKELRNLRKELDRMFKPCVVPKEFKSKEVEAIFKDFENTPIEIKKGEWVPILDRSGNHWRFASTSLLCYIADYMFDKFKWKRKWVLFEKVTGKKYLQQNDRKIVGDVRGWKEARQILDKY